MDDRVAPVLLNYRAEPELDWSPARRGDYPGMSVFLRDGDKVKETTRVFEETKVRLAQLYEHWEEAVELN